jgi:dolichol-phosphate mannosyltransferase
MRFASGGHQNDTRLREVSVDVSVILPTYNERDNIVPLIEAIQTVLAKADITEDIVVVDDNSPDGTAQAVRDRFGDHLRVRVFVRQKEHGLATAIAHGIRQAMGDVVVVMDTDFNHDPVLLPQMIKFLEFYDIIIGSRFTMGGGMEEKWRYMASFIFNFFVRQILRTQISDNLCGFFSMRREKLLDMDLDHVFQGYGEYFMHFLFLAWRKGYHILEVPAFYRVRPAGQSKSRFFHMLYSYSLTAIKVRLGIR